MLQHSRLDKNILKKILKCWIEIQYWDDISVKSHWDHRGMKIYTDAMEWKICTEIYQNDLDISKMFIKQISSFQIIKYRG